MITFIILRILDLITTLLNIKKYGNWDVELNPYMRWIGRKGLMIPYQIVIIIFVVLVLNRFKYKKVIYFGLSFATLIVVIINIWCLTL